MTPDRRPAPPDRAVTPAPDRATSGARGLLLVAVGGALGAVARVGFAELFPVDDGAYPWTTFAENLVGAFLLALVVTLLARRLTPDPGVRLFLCTGVLGSFTTYSTFAEEVAARALDGHVVLGGVYAVASVAGGVLAAVAGAAVAGGWPRGARTSAGTSGLRGGPR